ncbi:hypothetical protein JAAARDRAFT_37775 [Jaapia argillacea MUCL 33604]|uniref:Uncharacterized protein n=1 Tax=Jaapia argillacea MUCL 33604 TaxID=933084 RepID=A0A067PVC4_9AGAM|nr:hypothetical protein JAAARDRAFT_37775 [Jaapia argillacea MUCL 33604]
MRVYLELVGSSMNYPQRWHLIDFQGIQEPASSCPPSRWPHHSQEFFRVNDQTTSVPYTVTPTHTEESILQDMHTLYAKAKSANLTVKGPFPRITRPSTQTPRQEASLVQGRCPTSSPLCRVQVVIPVNPNVKCSVCIAPSFSKTRISSNFIYSSI